MTIREIVHRESKHLNNPPRPMGQAPDDTHTPYEAWCPHCVAARAVRRDHPSKKPKAHIVADTGESIEGPVTISMDYMYLHDRAWRNRDTKWNPPYLVVIEHRYGRCWAYQVRNKGHLDGAHWLPRRLVQDWDNCGLKDARVVFKTDQEPAMTSIQIAAQELRPKAIIPVNSPVGESEANGRAQNTIRRIQEKTRALRHSVEQGIGEKIPDEAPIMAWLVRWSAELLSKYSSGDDGKSPYERIRGQQCRTPLVPFGELILFLPMKTIHRNKGDPAKLLGIWLGINERTEEVLVGTMEGVIKCRTNSRMSADKCWDPKLVKGMRGVPWEAVPGKPGVPIPVEIKNNGAVVDGDEAVEAAQIPLDEEETKEIKFRGGLDKLHISRKAIERYGPTDGCPACTAISRRGHLMGRLGYNHNDRCRERAKGLMAEDPEYRDLIQRHQRGRGSADVTNVTQVDRDIDVVSTKEYEEMIGNIKNAIHCIQNKMREESLLKIDAQLEQTMARRLIANMQMADIYSPPRVTQVAREIGLRAGWSLDLTTPDADGKAWDFNSIEMRNRAIRKVLTDKPLLLIGSPMCTVYSAMNNVNHARMDPDVVKERFRYARKHLEFSTKLYKISADSGHYFLHEHPQGASSWEERCIKELVEKQGVMKVVGDQCMYGLKSDGGLARKRTGFLTNAVCIAQQLNKRCPNTSGYTVHQHVIFEGGRTKRAQVYPRELCKAICIGLQKQMQADKHGQFLLMEAGCERATSKDFMNASRELAGKYQIVEENEDESLERAWDDVSGAELDARQVKRARQEEIDYVHKMKLYEKVPKSECYRKTGKAPITLRWIDINKGDHNSPNYRSRLVAREINTYKRDELFAATPPLEALKMITSMTATGNKEDVLMVNDISRAFFHASVTRDVYVQLPKEDTKPGEEEYCGKLKFSMCGTRDAAQNWHQEYSNQLIQSGFKQGLASPCIFYHPEKGIRTYVHGDDYVSTGSPEALKWMQTRLESKYQVKTQMLGFGYDHCKQVKVFNRVVTWHGQAGITYEADPRHVELIIEQLGLQEAKGVLTPGMREEGRTKEEHIERLNQKETTRYRAVIARCNYLAPDRPDIAYAVKELARAMASPTLGDMQRFKRLGRYLKDHPRLQQW